MLYHKHTYLIWFLSFSTILTSFFLLQIGKSQATNIYFFNNNNYFQFNSTNAYNIIESQLNFGFRIPGTESSKNCGDYFIEHMNAISPTLPIFQHNFSVNTINCRNFLITINPNNPCIIILGAHYDSRAISEKDSTVNKRNEPCPGANDGASGVATLLELIRIFYEKRESLNCSIWILLFDAEDQGNGAMSGWDWCEGSKRFVENITNYYNPETQSIEAMILLDMVGGTNLEFINELNSNMLLLGELFEIGRSLGYLDVFPSNPVSSAITDDHLPFKELEIPVADLIINFWSPSSPWSYHHTTSDNISHISQESLEITGKTVEKFIYNHYLNSPEYENNLGNYPWKDINGNLNLDIIYYVVFFVLIVGIGISLIIIKKKNKFQKTKNKIKLK